MISVLICSANNFYLDQVRKNVQETIGVEHEILHFDNATEKKGICYVYNLLASQARFPFLCFVHEDILFKTANWGHTIVNVFAEKAHTGIIGVAGSKYKSKMLSGWYSGIAEIDCANIKHQYTYGSELIYLRPGASAATEDVVCVDGVFICSRKQIWEKVKFNEANLPGFHFYDIDFSLTASELCNINVTYEIDIVHITKGGDFGNNWVETALVFHSSFASKLPNTKLMNYSPEIEKRIAISWLDILKKYDISWKNKIRWIKAQNLQSVPGLYYSIARFLFYRPLGLQVLHKIIKRNK